MESFGPVAAVAAHPLSSSWAA
ncbi:MAG: hypothetical protein QOJ27_88, partial [Sphingomonadales bacterium]|nr:hypothetical protein [Sphingomonadales bacterium]